MQSYLPHGNTLDEETFQRRHLLLCWVLGLHLPALWLFGIWQGFGAAHSAIEIAVPTACLVFARLAINRRLAAFFVTAGLVFCSSVLVHLSNGSIEAHFHFFVLIGLIALYQDWVPFLWNVVFTVLSHGLGSSIAPDSMYNHYAAQHHPWTWAVIHGVAVLAACIGVIVFWKNTELEQQRATALSAELAQAELTAAQTEAAQRQSVSALFVNLARRNQGLLDRQLALISELEQRERTPDVLTDLFRLDHLATRIRRNAESLLVLSGDDPPRLWGKPVPLGDVARAAAAEIEDYTRVEILVNDHIEVVGRAVADLAHLLAELIENATTFSPPASHVRVRSHLVPGEWARVVLSVEDTGIGMSEEDLRRSNVVLAEPPEVDLRRSSMGFHVVSRLAKRYGIQVALAHTPGGGVTALVTLPNQLVSERREPVPAMHPVAQVLTAPLSHLGPPQEQFPSLPLPPPPPPPPPWAQTAPGPAPTAPAPATATTTTTTTESNGGAAPVPPPPPPPPVAPTPEPAEPPALEGLARRVPGAGLAAALREQSGSDLVETPPPTPPPDRERVHSMLSRFQVSQRAGRMAAAEEAVDDPSSEEEES
ncbi:MAG TPA: ATP-binding protein [Acidimicrobiales bacterium]